MRVQTTEVQINVVAYLKMTYQTLIPIKMYIIKMLTKLLLHML